MIHVVWQEPAVDIFLSLAKVAPSQFTSNYQRCQPCSHSVKVTMTGYRFLAAAARYFWSLEAATEQIADASAAVKWVSM